MKDQNLVVIFENAEKVSNTTAMLFSELLKIAVVYFQIPALLNTPCLFFFPSDSPFLLQTNI